MTCPFALLEAVILTDSGMVGVSFLVEAANEFLRTPVGISPWRVVFFEIDCHSLVETTKRQLAPLVGRLGCKPGVAAQ